MRRLSQLLRRDPKRAFGVPRWLERLASVGIVTADPEIARRQRITNVAAFVGAGTGLSHVVINSMHDARGLLLVHIANAVFAALAALTPNLHRVGENAAGLALATLVLIGTMAFVWLLGTASHVQMYLTLVGALLLFIGTQNWKVFLGYFALFTVALMVALHYGPREGLIEPQDTAVRDMLTNEVMVNVMVVNAAIIFYAVAALQRAQIELENAYERSEALVTAVIPQPIASRLKAKPDQRVADRIECLSILFCRSRRFH
jgi:adenylate cyclase